MREKIWKFKKKPDNRKVYELSQSLGISKAVCSLLVSRGIHTFAQAKTFFRPELELLHDPFLMKDMDKAVNRIVRAIDCQEKIRVYGDYDVDGTSSVSMMYMFLKSQGAKCDYYIPDRYQEGYGISFQGINDALENKCSLMISLDCGVKALDKIAHAQNNGMDVIVCDHHRPGKQLPIAFAILDPKRNDCAYPFKELCGCGVGFKLIQAYLSNQKLPKEIAYDYLDLVATATGADIVPMIGENRILTFYGMKLLNERPRVGIRSLMLGHKHFGSMTITDVVFTIAPRINAAGRMKHAHFAVSLLIEENESHAQKGALEIEEFNTNRRAEDQRIAQEALIQIKKLNQEDEPATVVYHEDWHKGVIGIVASRLIETYYRPTVVFTKSNGLLVASVRSVKGFDVYAALSECEMHIEQFGGHKYAAGLTLKQENYHSFKAAFNQVVLERISSDQKAEIFDIDTELEFSQITQSFYNIIRQFEPFGPENRAPLFCTRKLTDKGSRAVGQEKEHLKLQVYSEKEPEVVMNGIGFNMGNHAERLSSGLGFDLCYAIQENHWKGHISLQLGAKDLKIH